MTDTQLYTLSPSQYTQFVHCRYSWYLAYRADCSQIWPDSNYTGLGIRTKDAHLPLPIKLGAIWDWFQNAYYNKVRIEPADLMAQCDKYDLYDDATAKMFALVRSWYKLKFDIDLEGARPQHEFWHDAAPGFQFHGVMDVLYPGKLYIVENKLSGRPSRFRQLFNFHDQAAVYLLSHRSTHIVIRAVQVPMQKQGKMEDSETFRNRIVSDILSRPSHYFMGYDKKEHNFGLKFYRSEFNLDGLVSDFTHVFEDITRCLNDKSLCYQDKLSCHVPAQCMYLPVCETGVVSEQIYKPKQPQPTEEGVI